MPVTLPRPARLLAARPLVTLLAAGVLVAAAVAVGVVLARSTAPAGTETALLTLDAGPEPDGTAVTLDAAVVVAPQAPGADDEGRRPAVVLAHGFGGSRTDLKAQADELAAHGYVVMTYTARGFGASGGRIHLGDPAFEGADVSVVVDALARRDDVLLDADGDPRVAVVGGSYGGAAALLAAGLDDRVDAAVPVVTWNDLGQSLFPQAAHEPATDRDGPRVADPGVWKARWGGVFTAAASAGAEGGAPDPLCGRFDLDLCADLLAGATAGTASPALLQRLSALAPASVLDGASAPVLLLQGEQDSLFWLDEADATAQALARAGVPVAVRWIDGGHDGAGPGAGATDETTTDLVLAWLDLHLRGDASAADGLDLDGFSAAVPVDGPGADGPDELRTATYPGLRADVADLPLEGDPRPLLSPPDGQPAAVTALPGAGAVVAGLGPAAGALQLLPGQSATFATDPAQEAFVVAGTPVVRLSVTSSTTDAVLFASVQVVAADGSARLPRGLVAPLRLTGLTPGQPRVVDVHLPASAYRVAAGSSLRLVVGTTDAGYSSPADARTYLVAPVAVDPDDPDGPVLSVPMLTGATPAGTSPVPAPLVALTAALLAAALALALTRAVRSRRRQDFVDPAQADVPLRVQGLVKTYPGGFRAVDEVSWGADRGQVVGLLGPNGAGKTSTMRMLVGLVRPEAGSVHVLGRRVAPGAPVLAEVGALIEGPGFLPHRTGRQNLQAYWAATGRPAAEADLEEALEVAALGTAADRPVRSYSQGMRQRLGIAQALLGRPALLLLDEPTNGLDPPQIRALRQVLADYAATGRTVVVSSHLLSEVEATCSHVVVMHRGRVVATGSVPDLLAPAGPDGRSPRDLEEVFMRLIGGDGPVLSRLGGGPGPDAQGHPDGGRR